MTNETRRRIKHFEKALPTMRERVSIAFFALLIATLTAVAATYAWVTLSSSPAVSGVATTLAANGSLEIALASGDGTELPSDADIDESVGISTDVTVTNLQWGNLINISDTSYGIDDLTLRPAQLNTASLSSSPLWGAAYGSDGRITQLDSKYTYTKWDGSEFTASSEKGVRAIASYKTANSKESAAEFDNLYQSVLNAHTAVNTYYQNNVATQSAIGGLGSVVGNYLQSKLNGKGYGTSTDTNIAISTSDVQSLLNLFTLLSNAMDLEQDALVSMANLQQYIYAKEHEGTTYSEVDWTNLENNKNLYDIASTQHKSSPTTPQEAIAIKNLKNYIENRSKVDRDIAILQGLVEKSNAGTQIYTDDIATPVNDICNASNCKIDGQSVSYYLGDVTAAMDLTSGHHLVQIIGGVLGDFEQMAVDPSYRLPADKSSSTTSNAATIKATAKKSIITVSINMTGHLYTDASGNSYFMDDFGKISTEVAGTDKIAEDTYGMAVDFWIRSNAESTYLTLEGATTTDNDGNILSYDGVNRVWGATGNVALTTDSTTQGGGSCYIYYADTPEDMSRSLELLRSMKVAFVSQDGTLMATASMDTENYCAVNGRVVVPLAISQSESLSYTYTDIYGEEITAYAIKKMSLDEATLITAVIYLDGATLSNTQVLAAGDIQGQLNLQFGSSETMTTVGDNKLLTAERYVTAEVSKSSFDYDSGEELKTTVTLNVEGTDPETITAFFVRAVNSTQGKREETMTFTKQADGTWKSDYTFKLPGTYYLRYVRMDRVDYALENPPQVEVNGFAIASVGWGEGIVTEKTYYSTDSSYNESVSVTFQTTDGTRLPSTVQARFIREDGNAVTIETTYSASSGSWEGTGTFTASGTYTLSYLVLDNNYYDISSYQKTLTLYLGLTATVYNNSSPLTEEYDSSNAEKVYNRNVQVKILDNSGNALEELEGTRIYYSNGGSATNGVNANLTWNEETGYYEGILPITKAGRYVFSSITVNGNSLTKVTDSPTYIIMPPDAPEYDTASQSDYTGSDIQFSPLAMNGTMGKIRIANSSASQVSAVVYNSKTGEYYDIVSSTVQTEKGTMYYIASDGGYWMINLPTYTNEDDSENQDGTWSLVALKLWDCYDGTTNEDNYRLERNPLTWIGTSTEATKYASEKGITADATIDFSKLSTTVSCTVNIAMTSGTTALGSLDTAFMTAYKVADLGMFVSITDDDGNAIPSNNIGQVSLNVSYSANSDAATYGYAVSSAANKSYEIVMTQGADGSWTPNSTSNFTWQYVGEYKVTSLSVTVAGVTKTFNAGESGVPTEYTIKSKAPTADDLTVTKLSQGTTIFGVDANGNVTGEFLATYSPSVSVELTWKSDKLDANSHQYAMVSGLSMTVSYVYQNGTTAPNGGYSWTGSTGYETYTDTASTATNNGQTYTFSASGSKTLLAGTYAVTATLNWTENGTSKSKSAGTLSNISAYSVTPEVKVTGVSPSGEVTVNANGDGSESYLVSNASPFTASNRYGDYYAVAFMQYEAFNTTNNTATYGSYTRTTYSDSYANYTAPTVTLTTENVGDNTFSVTIPANGSNVAAQTVSFVGNTSQTVTIGSVVSNNQTKNEVYNNSWLYGDQSADFTYKAENAYILGTKTITTMTSKIGNATYTVTLKNPIIISQTNVQSPKLTFTAPEGMKISVVQSGDGMGVGNGGMVSGLTALTVTVTAEDGYYSPYLTTPSNALNWTVVSQTEEKAVYTFNMPYDNVNLSGGISSYPTLRFTADNTYATITATDSSGNVITSGGKVKTGEVVTLTVTAKSDAGYYAPRLSERSTWEATEGDYTSTYTFSMTTSNVTAEAPTASTMAKLNWSDTAALTFSAVDQSESNRSISSGGYVIPGHSVLVTLVANGGVNPNLTAPSNAAQVSAADDFTRQYKFTMPSSDVTLAGTAQAYPVVKFESDKAAVTSLLSNGANIEVGNATEKGIKPGNTVKITITAKEGYYAPRLSQPSGVTNWTVVSESNSSATYSFTMPNSEFDLGSKITATAAPTVTISGSNATIAIAGTNYDGTALSGYSVQPGTVVTVSAAVASGYFSPMVSSTTATLSTRTGDYDNAAYTFTMGTSDVTLTGSATQDPTVTVTNGSYLSASSITVNGSTVTRAHPGSTVKVQVTAASAYYNPELTVSSGGVSLSSKTVVTQYESAYYTFTMGTSAVSLTGKATANPTITVTNSNSTVTASKTGSVRPGTIVSVSVTPATNYYIPKVTATGIALTGETVTNTKTTYSDFTMGTSNVTLTGSATEMPYIYFTSIGSVSVYQGSSASGTKFTANSTKWYVYPGAEVYVFAENTTLNRISNANKYPVVTLTTSGAATISRTAKSGGIAQYYDSTWKITVSSSKTTGAINFTATGNSASS